MLANKNGGFTRLTDNLHRGNGHIREVLHRASWDCTDRHKRDPPFQPLECLSQWLSSSSIHCFLLFSGRNIPESFSNWNKRPWLITQEVQIGDELPLAQEQAQHLLLSKLCHLNRVRGPIKLKGFNYKKIYLSFKQEQLTQLIS